ncbi:hypothetical protein [Pseudonocardia xishanensis]|uniref:hypothetical protein n=1 Tax=Pseudonocardia xishanensis TaxID=630995 RepID=UPI0031EC1885
MPSNSGTVIRASVASSVTRARSAPAESPIVVMSVIPRSRSAAHAATRSSTCVACGCSGARR